MAAYRFFMLRVFSDKIKGFMNGISTRWAGFREDVTPALSLCPSMVMPQQYENGQQPSSILDGLLGNGLLWAVPTHRRTVEKRMTRKMAIEKRLKPKKNLLVCNVCGHYHEAHTICGNCYEQVRLETEAMQDAIQKKLGLNPVDKEVVVVYKNDPRGEPGDRVRIVEMEKERPTWFSKNLLTKAYIASGQAEDSRVAQSAHIQVVEKDTNK